MLPLSSSKMLTDKTVNVSNVQIPALIWIGLTRICAFNLRVIVCPMSTAVDEDGYATVIAVGQNAGEEEQAHNQVLCQYLPLGIKSSKGRDL